MLSGSVVLAVGVWLRCDPDTDQLLTGDGAPDSFFIAVYILIGAGGLMMVVGFFGCFGAVRESQCLLASIVEEVQKFYSNSIADASNPSYNGTTILTMYHTVLHCCGGSTPDPVLCPDTEEDTKVLGMVFSMVLCCAIRNSREII
ncbi:hypothetical protein CRUP_036734 [Coryphaenoides rupestris]|nr:hypothetical protein CRUP_036734 [Coryphaenoides rupestris]